jgi:hypothetical protein
MNPLSTTFNAESALSAKTSRTGGKSRQNKAPTPFSLRLTFEERAFLEKAAGGMPLGSYIRSSLLGDDVKHPRRARRAKIEDKEALGRVLGKLGQSKLANNLNQLARAANSGSLDLDPDTKTELLSACADIRAMRADLMKALGLNADGEETSDEGEMPEPTRKEPVRSSPFSNAAP